MTRHTWVLIGLLALPISAQAALFGFGDNKSDVATKIATLNEENEILGLDFSADGKHLAATPFDSATVHIWDWRDNRLERTLVRAHGANVTVTEPVRYSPDGKLLAICHTRAAGYVVAQIWNTDTWNVVHEILEPIGGGGCDAIGFIPDGKSLIRILQRLPQFSGDTLVSYNTTSWNASWGIRTVPFYPTTLAISPDGKYIAIGGGVRNPNSWSFSTTKPTFGNPPLPDTGLIAIVDTAQHSIIKIIKTNDGDRGSLAWSQDGVHLAYENRYGVEIFDVLSGERVVDERKQSDRRNVHIRYTPDGKYFIESDFGQGGTRVRIWDGKHQQLLQEIKALPGCIAVSRDGHYMAMGGDKKIIVWQLK